MKAAFPRPLQVYFHEQYGYLTVNNRTLVVFHLALQPHTMIAVKILTQEQANYELAVRGGPTVISRLTTKDAGTSIEIRGRRGRSEGMVENEARKNSPYYKGLKRVAKKPVVVPYWAYSD